MELLKTRAVLKISGSDKEKFLQSLITNDINLLNTQKALYALMLTPQGKYFADLFIYNKGEEFLIDVPSIRLEIILAKLKLYKLRSDVLIELTNYQVYFSLAKIGVENEFPDPRLENFGYRIYGEFACSNINNYDLLRIDQLMPEGEADLIFEKSFPLEYGMEKFNAISFKKGCYVGQEVVSRIYHQGTIRKKIVKIIADNNELPSVGTEIFYEEKKLGIFCSAQANKALALIYTEDYNNYSNKKIRVEVGPNNLPLELVII